MLVGAFSKSHQMPKAWRYRRPREKPRVIRPRDLGRRMLGKGSDG